ncbi:MAG TPA: hypothetical protein VF045_09855 [Acidimicrobiales bacterium]
MLGFAIAVLLVVATACGGSGDGRASPATVPGAIEPGQPARVSLLPTSTSTPVRTAPNRFEFVDYVVVGGLAPVDDWLKVYPDGRALYQGDGRTVNYTIPAATIAALRSALERADLPSLPPVDTTVAGSADLRARRVIFGGRSVRFHDGTMPPALGPAIEILDRELARGKSMR